MSSFVIKYIANRVLKDNQWNRVGVEDPYYEFISLNPEGTKTKKVKRRIPEGLSVNDTKVLDTVRKKAYRYDMWFSFLGVKFGWSNIVGLVPVAGQIVSSYWSLTMLVTARSLDDGLPLDIQGLFIVNILIDFLLGLIPIVGDLIEIGYKANLRNFLLLEKHLFRVGQKNLGNLEPKEVRPGFLNDKVQPIIENKIIPGTMKASKEFRNYVHDSYQIVKEKRGFNVASTTTLTSPTQIDSKINNRRDSSEYDDSYNDDDSKSIRSLNETLKKYD